MILCDRVGFVRLATITLNTCNVKSDVLFDYVSRCDNSDVYTNTKFYIKHLLCNNSIDISYQEVLQNAITQPNWLRTNITNKLLLKKIILDKPESILLNISVDQINNEKFQFGMSVANLNDSELFLLLLLADYIDITNFNKLENLNNLFFSILTKFIGDTIIFDHNQNYYEELIKLFDLITTTPK